MTPYSHPRRFLSSDEIDAVILEFFTYAEHSKARAALCGGVAMHFYGSDRQTSDVDFMADKALLWDEEKDKHQITSDGQLSFGGLKYRGSQGTVVDWIIRRDEQSFVYEAALAERMRTTDGFYVIRPEWLALIKMLAGRTKDEFDLLYLLRAKDLVKRDKLLKHIKTLFGREAFVVRDNMKQFFLQADMMQARDEGR
jgi:hypothetical protein